MSGTGYLMVAHLGAVQTRLTVILSFSPLTLSAAVLDMLVLAAHSKLRTGELTVAC